MKTDITEYSNEELSLYFMNDEGLYNNLQFAVRRDNFKYLESIADELFIYSDEQLDDLKNTFDEELNEYNEE